MQSYYKGWFSVYLLTVCFCYLCSFLNPSGDFHSEQQYQQQKFSHQSSGPPYRKDQYFPREQNRGERGRGRGGWQGGHQSASEEIPRYITGLYIQKKGHNFQDNLLLFVCCLPLVLWNSKTQNRCCVWCVHLDFSFSWFSPKYRYTCVPEWMTRCCSVSPFRLPSWKIALTCDEGCAFCFLFTNKMSADSHLFLM